MNATPPEAGAEYSRAPAVSEAAAPPTAVRPSRLQNSVPAAVLACGVIGAALLVISEFTDLYQIHVTTQRAAISSVTGGSHNTYAFIPIAILALLLAYGAGREGSRPALLALGALGVISLLIALIGDLPNAQSSGLLMEGGHFATASSNPTTGMYLETLGSIVLLLACGLGFFLGGLPPRRPRARRPPARRPRVPLS
jgi:hypothetical protein